MRAAIGFKSWKVVPSEFILHTSLFFLCSLLSLLLKRRRLYLGRVPVDLGKVQPAEKKERVRDETATPGCCREESRVRAGWLPCICCSALRLVRESRRTPSSTSSPTGQQRTSLPSRVLHRFQQGQRRASIPKLLLARRGARRARCCRDPDLSRSSNLASSLKRWAARQQERTNAMPDRCRPVRIRSTTPRLN